MYQTNSLSNRVRALEHIVFRSPAHSGWVRSHGAMAVRCGPVQHFSAMLCRMSASSRWFWEAVLARSGLRPKLWRYCCCRLQAPIFEHHHRDSSPQVQCEPKPRALFATTTAPSHPIAS